MTARFERQKKALKALRLKHLKSPVRAVPSLFSNVFFGVCGSNIPEQKSCQPMGNKERR
jgi:hypothetical protein